MICPPQRVRRCKLCSILFSTSFMHRGSSHHHTHTQSRCGKIVQKIEASPGIRWCLVGRLSRTKSVPRYLDVGTWIMGAKKEKKRGPTRNRTGDLCQLRICHHTMRRNALRQHNKPLYDWPLHTVVRVHCIYGRKCVADMMA